MMLGSLFSSLEKESKAKWPVRKQVRQYLDQAKKVKSMVVF